MKSLFWPDTLVAFVVEHHLHHHQQVGQFFMRLLEKNQPDVADLLRGSRHDPSYAYSISYQVIDFCWEHWNLDLMANSFGELVSTLHEANNRLEL